MFPDALAQWENIEKKCTITYLYQQEPKGESDAISYARDIVNAHSLAIHYPDNIYSPAPGALKRLKSVYEYYREDVAALMEVKEQYAAGIGNSGRVDLTPVRDNVYRIERFHPKGQGHFVPRFKGELRTCGIAISGPHIFDYIERACASIAEAEFTDVPVRSLMLKEKGLLGVRLPGMVFDVGNPDGYKLCLKYIRDYGKDKRV